MHRQTSRLNRHHRGRETHHRCSTDESLHTQIMGVVRLSSVLRPEGSSDNNAFRRKVVLVKHACFEGTLAPKAIASAWFSPACSSGAGSPGAWKNCTWLEQHFAVTGVMPCDSDQWITIFHPCFRRAAVIILGSETSTRNEYLIRVFIQVFIQVLKRQF